MSGGGVDLLLDCAMEVGVDRTTTVTATNREFHSAGQWQKRRGDVCSYVEKKHFQREKTSSFDLLVPDIIPTGIYQAIGNGQPPNEKMTVERPVRSFWGPR